MTTKVNRAGETKPVSMVRELGSCSVFGRLLRKATMFRGSVLTAGCSSEFLTSKIEIKPSGFFSYMHLPSLASLRQEQDREGKDAPSLGLTDGLPSISLLGLLKRSSGSDPYLELVSA